MNRRANASDQARLIVRAFAPEGGDLEAWTAIHNQRLVALGTLQIPFTPSSSWKQRLESGSSERVLVAELDGEVIGCTALHLGSGRTRHSGSLGMGVSVEHQGRGVGSALLAALIDLADNWYNLRRLELEVYADNEAGIGLYRKFGFQDEGIYRKYAYRNGTFVDALAMARLRDDPW